MGKRLLFVLLMVGGWPLIALAQTNGLQNAGLNGTPQRYQIMAISVDGVDNENLRDLVRLSSGLSIGDEVLVPGDEKFARAIHALYRLGSFSDVSIQQDRVVGNGIFIGITVTPEPKLNTYEFTGISDGDGDKIRRQSPLVRGRAVKPADIERTKQVITQFYEDQGYRGTHIVLSQEELSNGDIALAFAIDKGEKLRVTHIIPSGNVAFDDGDVRGAMKETKEKRWWRFWKKETYTPHKYQDDLDRIIAKYNEEGYYDARILRDSVYTFVKEDGDEEIHIEVDLYEGPRYRIRNITWSGNTEFTDEQLNLALGFREGDWFNAKQLDENLRGNASSLDVSSLYLDRGYMTFNTEPVITVVEGDSLDLQFDIMEGDIYEFGSIDIAGNTKTKEHVIRRELRTLPGQRFSREGITRSIRQLAQLNYFDMEKLGAGPGIDPDHNEQKVNLTYNLEEAGGDQIELSGGWGGRFTGVIFQVGVTFNNFSLQNIFNKESWDPLPSGDGQKLSLRAQRGGNSYQQYSISFQEPWFRGKPTPIGFSVSHARYDFGVYTRYQYEQINGRPPDPGEIPDDRFSTTTMQLSYGQRLKWPDDYFSASSVLGYRFYNVSRENSYYGLPQGLSQELSIRQSLSRNSFDNPIFPSSGSSLLASVEVAIPVSTFVQYHKWTLDTDWYIPLAGKLSFGIGARFGYIGSLTGDRVEFQRYLVGGTPLQAQNGYYGRDLVFMRGYPIEAISPRSSGAAVGGTILNSYTAELKLLALQSPQFQVAPYIFFDAANTWDSFRTYNPSNLFRSTGFGAKIFMPILGMLEVNYGYNFDQFAPVRGDDGIRKWRFQFTLGQSF